MPIYFLFGIPRKVKTSVEKIQRDFLWGWGVIEKTLLVKQKSCLLDKDQEGLGVKCLETLNKALLGQWLCRFAHEDCPLGKKVTCSKCRVEEGGWFTKDERDAYGVGFWKDTRNEVAVLKQFYIFPAGDCRHVLFWEDIWCGEEPLYVTVPNIYTMATAKWGLVADFWDSSGAVGVGENPCIMSCWGVGDAIP